MSDIVESLDSGPIVLKFWVKVATSAWFTWLARNNFIFSRIHINCAFVIMRISSTSFDYQSVYGRVQDQLLLLSIMRWLEFRLLSLASGWAVMLLFQRVPSLRWWVLLCVTPMGTYLTVWVKNSVLFGSNGRGYGSP
ncbi:hypothetical protein LguiA_000073 [Lonicera macranthoides]